MSPSLPQTAKYKNKLMIFPGSELPRLVSLSSLDDLTPEKDCILMENSAIACLPDEPSSWGGLCFDFAHYETAKNYQPELFASYQDNFAKYPIKAAHISAYHADPQLNQHVYSRLSDFDYLNQYLHLLPEVCALELENSIVDQLEAKKFLENKLLQNLAQILR